MRGRWIWPVLALLAVTGTVVAIGAGWLRVPPYYDPFAPLDVNAPPTPVTWLKLLRVEHDPPACLQALETARLDYRRLPDRRTGDGCGLADTVHVHGGAVDFNRPFVATCPLAVSISLFERHVVQAAAERHFGEAVARIEHLGTYACRNLYGRERGRRSEHATANAIDVAACVLSDGRRIVVERDWPGDDAAAAFLRDVREGGCRFFDVVLSPDYNAAHRDHFHFDMGSFTACK